MYQATWKMREPQHDVIQWKRFPRYWPFVWGIHRSPVNFPHKGQRRGALIFSLICAWINGWVNNREAGDLRHHRAHYDVIVMYIMYSGCIKRMFLLCVHIDSFFPWDLIEILDLIFKQILVIDSTCTSCGIAIREVSPSDEKSTPLVQVMAWRHQAKSHYPSQWWSSYMSPNCVTGPQWVNLPLWWLHESRKPIILKTLILYIITGFQNHMLWYAVK